jgi:hypothetical protein
MLHLTLDEHACGEGLNKGWRRAGDISAVQILELTAGFRFLKISRLSIVRQSEGACRISSQNRNVIPTWLGANPSRL